ncbi:hypothetical protein D3C73_1619750 [compost metagenome]
MMQDRNGYHGACWPMFTQVMGINPIKGGPVFNPYDIDSDPQEVTRTPARFAEDRHEVVEGD